MSKVKYVDVLGLKQGKTPEVVATFSTRPVANWHIKNTLEGLGYDRFLLRTANKKGPDFVNDLIAEDKGVYVKTIASMNITDLETVTTQNTLGTLLGFVLSGDIASKTGLNKLTLVEEPEDEVSENLEKSLITIYEVSEPLEIDKIKTRLSTELLDAFVGVSEDTEESEPEEDVVEEIEPDLPKKEEPKKEVKEKQEPKKEEPKEEEPTEEDLDLVIEEDLGETEELEEDLELVIEEEPKEEEKEEQGDNASVEEITAEELAELEAEGLL